MCRGHLPPVSEEPEEVETLRPDEIEVKSFVGGLVKGFERKAGRSWCTMTQLAATSFWPLDLDQICQSDVRRQNLLLT